MNRINLILILLWSFTAAFAQDPVTSEELKEHVYFLASDDLEGRKPGTEGAREAAEYILNEFESYGLVPIAENGYQYFKVVTKVELGGDNTIEVAGQEYDVENDFIPLGFSENGSIKADVIFAGYGFNIENDSVKWNDYADVNVEKKWAMILLGDPENSVHGGKYFEHSAARKKVLVATDNKAAGVIFVAGPEYEEEDKLPRLSFDQSKSTAGVPVVQVTRDLADKILSKNKKTVKELEDTLNKTNKPVSFDTKTEISAEIEVEQVKVKTQNVLAVVPGTDSELKDEYIVVGAHYDHLGYGGWGSGSRSPDTVAIHNGADDNASGVASILELAEYFSKLKPKRSILFMTFGAEEMGLLGSKFFTKTPVVDLKSIRMMINLDMVGRLNDEKKLTIGGTGTAKGLEDLVTKTANNFDLNVAKNSEGTGPSDHASFYLANIPVLFLFTGTHDDYHKPGDDPEKINYDGMKTVADFTIALMESQINAPEKMEFTEAGSQQEQRRMRFKVTLGIIPDYASDASGGLRLDGVKKDGPADKAGLIKGDVIVSMAGKEVKNIYDYMGRLGEFKSGQQIVVEVMRGEEKKALNVTF